MVTASPLNTNGVALPKVLAIPDQDPNAWLKSEPYASMG
ncbi:unannotated protein [freshwater metagenome]|uniref:Unannotated protein n=1 Tax=freshwater metagenome TaxID=449393 RepID=A0A6J7VHC2_9ZZZZ